MKNRTEQSYRKAEQKSNEEKTLKEPIMSKRGAIALMLFITAVMCFALTACSHQEAPDTSNEIHIRIINEVDSAFGFGLTYYFDDVPVHSTGMKNANGDKIVDNYVEFTLMKGDVPKEADLEKFGLQFMVTEESGVELSVCTVYFPIQFGNTYTFKLVNEDGCYAVWSESDGETHSGPQINSNAGNTTDRETAVQVEDIVGTWYLDKEKNNLSAIESAWDIFPDCAEWDASMEFCSDSFMRWNIGTAGGLGTYCIEGNVLHTARYTEERQEIPTDFVIMGRDEIVMTYAGMEITWVHGAPEETPANDE